MKNSRKDNPSSIFYWKDYENDEGLRISSLAAQGLWMRLLCIAAKADPYGYILVNGCDIGVTGAARLGSVTEAEAATLLDELERNGVFSRDRKGRTFSRRMVKDAGTRAKNTKNGKKGGNPALSASDGKQTEKDVSLNPPLKAPLKAPYPLPSSLTPEEKKKEDGGGGSAGMREAEILPPEKNSPEPFREKILTAIGVDPVSGMHGPNGRMIGTQSDMAEAARWLALPGITEDVALAEVRSVMHKKRDGPPSTFRFFSKAMERLSGELAAPQLTPTIGVQNGKPQSERRAFDGAIRETARRLSEGSIAIDYSRSDPFAQR